MDCDEQQRHSYGAAVYGAAVPIRDGAQGSHTACRPVGRDFTCEGSFSAEVGGSAEATSAARVSGSLLCEACVQGRELCDATVAEWAGGHQAIWALLQHTVPFRLRERRLLLGRS